MCRVVHRSADGSKTVCAGDHDAVIAAGAVDNQEVSGFVPASDDPDVTILRVKHKIAGGGIDPCDRGAVGVLHGRAAAVTEDVCAAAGVVKCPVGKPGAVEAVGPVGAGGGAAVRPYLLYGSPAAVPAEDKRLRAPKVAHLSDKLTSRFHDGAALRRQIVGEVFQKLLRLLLRGGEVGQKQLHCGKLR